MGWLNVRVFDQLAKASMMYLLFNLSHVNLIRQVKIILQ